MGREHQGQLFGSALCLPNIILHTLYLLMNGFFHFIKIKTFIPNVSSTRFSFKSPKFIDSEIYGFFFISDNDAILFFLTK